jgi:hypothetical protein
VVQESLRSRPVIPFVLRYASEPIRVGDYLAPAASLIAISISLIHQRPDLYPEPAAFRPERFEDERPQRRAVTFAPHRGTRVVLRWRVPASPKVHATGCRTPTPSGSATRAAATGAPSTTTSR